MTAESRLPKPRVGDPIIFRTNGIGSPERVVRPCTGKHREYWLGGFMVLSCKKCMRTVELFGGPDFWCKVCGAGAEGCAHDLSSQIRQPS